MAIERINLRLDSSIQSEREILAVYESISRSRRQEWLRSMIRAGMAATSNCQSIVVPQPAAHVAASVISPATNVALMPGQAPQANVIVSPSQSDPAPARVVSAVAPYAAPASVEAGSTPTVAQPQSTPAEVKPKTTKGSASVLKGFLPESSAASALS